MKLFSKVFIYIQLHGLEPSGGVEKLELPNNPEGIQFEVDSVFRLFELFDRGERPW